LGKKEMSFINGIKKLLLLKSERKRKPIVYRTKQKEEKKAICQGRKNPVQLSQGFKDL
jgi:hypothetical protein